MTSRLSEGRRTLTTTAPIEEIPNRFEGTFLPLPTATTCRSARASALPVCRSGRQTPRRVADRGNHVPAERRAVFRDLQRNAAGIVLEPRRSCARPEAAAVATLD